MAQAYPFAPALLFMGLLVVKQFDLSLLYQKLQQNWGPIQTVSASEAFSYTDYYNQEMGEVPIRSFIIFTDLIDPSRLAQIKLQTNEIEHYFASDTGRQVNLDPGLLSAENIILATTKHRGHRIPLEKGIYGEVTLLYTKNTYIDFPWTYPDYKSPQAKEFFLTQRQLYLQRIRKGS